LNGIDRIIERSRAGEDLTRAAGANFGSYVAAGDLRARIRREGLRPVERTTLDDVVGGDAAPANLLDGPRHQGVQNSSVRTGGA